MAAHGIEKKRTRYTPAEIDKALIVLAHCGGNSRRASTILNIPYATLDDWRLYQHPARYSELAEREGPKLEAIAVDQARATMIQVGEAEHGVLRLLHDRIADSTADEPQRDNFPSDKLYELALECWLKRGSSKELSELAGTVQRLSTAKGINGTKVLEFTGRPTSIVEHRDPRAEIRAMAREFGITIDSTAEDVSEQRTLPSDSKQANAREAASAAQSQTPAAD